MVFLFIHGFARFKKTIVKFKNAPLILAALIFAGIACMPDLYSLFQNLHSWVPVNSYPYSIGDDYYYFSILNAINHNFFSLPRDPLFPEFIAKMDTTTLLAYVCMLPFYKIGTFLVDQRFGILFVRLAMAAFFYLSAHYLINAIRKSRTSDMITTANWGLAFENHALIIWIFLLLPKVSRIFQYPIHDSFFRHISVILQPILVFQNSSFNFFTRAMNASVTAPLFLFSLTVLLWLFGPKSKKNLNLDFTVPTLIFIFFCFLRLPQALVFLFLSFLLLLDRYRSELFTVHWKKMLPATLALLVIPLALDKYMFTNEVSQQVVAVEFANPFAGLSLSDIFLTVFKALSVFLIPLSFFLLFRRKYPRVVFILFFGVTIFNICNFMGAVHLNRFWQRVAEIPYGVFTFYFLAETLVTGSKKIFRNRNLSFISPLLAILSWGIFCTFFFNSSVDLYQTNDRKTLRPELLNYLLKHQESDSIIITNSTDVAYWVPMYTHRKIIFKDLVLQPFHYSRHFKGVMTNFAILGTEKQTFKNFLMDHQKDPAYGWLKDRPFSYLEKEKYTQYLADDTLNLGLYRTFNTVLKKDEFILADYTLTEKMFDFVEQNYPSVLDETQIPTRMDVILDQNASEILPVAGSERFTASKSEDLDGKQIKILQDARLVNFTDNKSDPNSCKIIQAVTVIDKPGNYCLGSDITSSETIIRINHDNVQLYLNGHSLIGNFDKTSRAAGIEITKGQNIQITGGTIRGFFIGVHAEIPVDSESKPTLKTIGISLKNLSIENSSFRGIQIIANNTIIENNLISKTGGTTVFEDAYAIGIELSGFNGRIESNKVSDTLPVGIGEGVGISLSNNGENGLVKNNLIENNIEPNQFGRTIGIWSGDSNRNSKPVFTNNVVKNYMFAVLYINSANVFGNTFIGTRCISKNKNSRYVKEQPRILDALTTNKWLKNQTNCTETPETYTKLAEAGDHRAQFLLARIYRDGLLVQTDLKKSHYWLELAAKNGNTEAKRVLPFWIKEN